MAGPRLAVLLRAVNVGGRNRLPMDELVAALAGHGYGDVATYIQSGNVVLDAVGAAGPVVAAGVEAVIAERFGLDVRVVARTHDELCAVIAANPFPEAARTPAAVHVGFLDRVVAPADAGRLDPAAVAPDRFAVGSDHVYLHYPNGSGRSRLSAGLLERRLGAVVTVRNWNTVLRLRELTAESP